MQGPLCSPPCIYPKQLKTRVANLTGVPGAKTSPKGMGKFKMYNSKWFSEVKNLDELRKKWRILALQYHPDRGGDTSTMQEINNEYDQVSARLIGGNNDFSDDRKTYETEASENIKDTISEIIHLQGIIIEIIGSWIWITGNTKPVKETLKENGFKFSRNKVAWYRHHGNYRKKNGKSYDMQTIREMWGSQKVNNASHNQKDEKEKSKSVLNI